MVEFTQSFGDKLAEIARNCGAKPLSEEERAANIAEADEQRRQEIVRSKRRRMKVPPLYLNAMPTHAAVKAWAMNPTSGLMLYGSYGVGKTYEACGVLNMRGQGRFASLGAIADECRAAIDNGTSRTDVLDKYLNTDMLVIDDLGKEKPTDYVLEILFRLIDGRLCAELPTVVTTNCAAGNLYARLSQAGDSTMAGAIMSRLGGFAKVEITGKDRRL